MGYRIGMMVENVYGVIFAPAIPCTAAIIAFVTTRFHAIIAAVANHVKSFENGMII